MSVGIILGPRPRSTPVAKASVKAAPLPQAFRLGAARIPNEMA
jgi:hypothetical protein